MNFWVNFIPSVIKVKWSLETVPLNFLFLIHFLTTTKMLIVKNMKLSTKTVIHRIQ